MFSDDHLINTACGICRLAKVLVSANKGTIDSAQVFIETWPATKSKKWWIEHWDQIVNVELEDKLPESSKRYTLFLDTGTYGIELNSILDDLTNDH